MNLSDSRPQRIAIIDLGSNTARLIVMNAISGYAYHLADEIREVVRLRQGLNEQGLDEAAMRRAIFTLRLFKRFCDSTQVDLIIATATSAVREGANGPLFVERVRSEVGLSLRVLDGEQEAYYATLGVLNELPLNKGFVLDIGGGSMQVSWVSGRRFKRGQSLTLGALALTEQFVHEDPVPPAALKAIQTEIQRQLDTVSWLRPADQPWPMVGLGGTIRNLARMEAARHAYPLNTLHGFTLTRASIAQSLELFQQLPLAERRKIAGLNSDRADIILPGAMVVLAVMERLSAEQLNISVNGLREGLFFEHFWQHLSFPVIRDVQRFAVLNMARVYRYEKSHANYVRYLAGRIFNELAPLHGYGPSERRLLEAAALLHDIGTLINYEDHHKHSETLITNNGLPGFAPREVALIALLTRFHRRGTPDCAAYRLLCGADDLKRLTVLAAILRLAEFLERGRNGIVDDVAVTWDDDSLTLTLIADEYPAVELWEAERNALALMSTVFNRRVILESTAAPQEWHNPNL